MKLPTLHSAIALVALVFLPSIQPAEAGVLKNDDGTYTIDGIWTFWTDRDLLAPSGRENNFGEFQTVLFKPNANNFEGIRLYKRKAATFKVKARESMLSGGERVLVVEEIIEVLGGELPKEKVEDASAAAPR